MNVRVTKGRTINRVGAEQNEAGHSQRLRCMLQCTREMQLQCIHSGK